MQKIDEIVNLAGHKKEDLSVCMGCRICASVCTVNDLSEDPRNTPVVVNPQELLVRLFLGREIEDTHPLVKYCTSCYRCTDACPWKIRIPEIVRALRESLHVASPFEDAFKGSLKIWGRVYEPYVFLMSIPFLLKEGYIPLMVKWTEYMSIHLPHKVKGRS
jgi:Fe-S oxidoreductase